MLLVLASLTNVIGYQTVQSSNQKTINEDVNQKELLFQTILDIANNKEIQGIILKSQVSKARFLDPDKKIHLFNTPVLTKNQIRRMYCVGEALSKIVSTSWVRSMVEMYQADNQGLEKEITNVIEKNALLKNDMTQLSNFNCHCENDNTTSWAHPVICILLIPLGILAGLIFLYTFDPSFLFYITNIGIGLHCFWIY